jgi:hypothetical protein
LQVARAIDDGVPVDQARAPRLRHDVAEAAVLLLIVRDQITTHELVVELPEREVVALREIVADDPIGVTDRLQRLRFETVLLVLNLRHGRLHAWG